MIKFNNGLVILGNPQITKNDFGVKIINDFGLNLELSNNIWNILIQNK
jgi:hypothetical protein